MYRHRYITFISIKEILFPKLRECALIKILLLTNKPLTYRKHRTTDEALRL